MTYKVKISNGLVHKHIDQLGYQHDFASTKPPNNKYEIGNPEILVDKDIHLQQPVASQLKSPSTPEPLIVTSVSTPSIANETSTTEKLPVKPDIPLAIHNRPQRTRRHPVYHKDYET